MSGEKYVLAGLNNKQFLCMEETTFISFLVATDNVYLLTCLQRFSLVSTF